MIKKIIISLTVLFILSSCMVPQSDYNELKSENDVLKSLNKKLETLNEKLRSKLDLIEFKNREIEEAKLKISLRTEEEALRLIEDYYKFYNANMTYRNPQLRRNADNEFKVSLEECINKDTYKEGDFFWHSRVLTLEINNDGTYKVN
ncbi:hypothetical protein IWX84_003030 [Flavobacterium sp. CG_9.10]|uniref:hypothetical protein n=1 Tax=Flavobacterium sp. CG_9.10 TaxID=2787729 RepID=UPI0018CADF5C|nr:hypothetical protein [Flavobacterium sp. CG_9.10]MBG6112134.1 hypothetical protein [Flavobacterium sp. CG_9.10]